MIAKIAWRHGIATFASHDRARVPDVHPPTTIADLCDRESEHIAVEGRGSFEIRDGDNECGVENDGADRLPGRFGSRVFGSVRRYDEESIRLGLRFSERNRQICNRVVAPA